MAFCGINMSQTVESGEVLIVRPNLSASLIRPSFFPLINKRIDSSRRRTLSIRCQSSRETVYLGFRGACPYYSVRFCGGRNSHDMQFNVSDFKICDQVSVGLGGRGDEVVFEAVDKNVRRPLHESRVVLRRLASAQAQLRGKHAIEV